MFLNITDETAIVLMVLASVFAIIVSIFIFKAIKKENRRFSEEKLISIEGLFTKTAINSQIKSYLSKIAPDSNFSLLLMEVMEFQGITDAFGKKEAERALEKAIFKVIQAVPKRIQIASYGGTRFLVFIKTEYDRFYAIDLARKIISVVSKPIRIFRDTNVNFSSNIGVCFYPKHGTKFKQLISSLEIALHNAKNAGENKYMIGSQEVKTDLRDNIQYHFEIKEAIEKKEFIMVYQPIIDIDANQITGFEAFVRWQHPKHGLLSPVQFLNIMEQTGDINWIGIWGIETIIKQFYELNRNFPEIKLTFNLNISPRQLVDEKIAEEFGKQVKRYRMNSTRISLEVTEYSTYEKNIVIRNNLAKLKKLGFRIAINGFGLDYVTIEDLESMPIDIIRLDKQYFDREKDSYIKGKLTNLIVDFAKQNKKELIGEGIESLEMLNMVKAMGIRVAQGFVFSKLLLATELDKYISGRSWEKVYQAPEVSTINQETIKEVKKPKQDVVLTKPVKQKEEKKNVQYEDDDLDFL